MKKEAISGCREQDNHGGVSEANKEIKSLLIGKAGNDGPMAEGGGGRLCMKRCFFSI